MGKLGKQTISNPNVQEHLCTLLGYLPPRCNRSYRRFPAKISELLEGVSQDISLLLYRHGDRVLGGKCRSTSASIERLHSYSLRVNTHEDHYNARSLIGTKHWGDCTHISWPASRTAAICSGKVSKLWPGMRTLYMSSMSIRITHRRDRLTWDEPSRLDAIFLEKLQETRCTDLTSEHTLYRTRQVPASISRSILSPPHLTLEMSPGESSPPYEPSLRGRQGRSAMVSRS